MPDPLTVPGLTVPELLELDRRHVWHPYGPMPGPVSYTHLTLPTICSV